MCFIIYVKARKFVLNDEVNYGNHYSTTLNQNLPVRFLRA